MDNHRFVPLGELPGYDQFDPEADKLSWDFSLPPTIDQERIVLDTHSLSRQQNIGAIRSSHFTEYRGGSTEYDVEVTGINHDSTASAGKASVSKQADVSASGIQDDLSGFGSYLMRDYFKTQSIHHLNKDEIASMVVELRDEKQVSREQAWAKVLNSAVRNSMNDAAYQHLVDRKSVPMRVLDGAVIGANGGNIGADIVMHDPQMAGYLVGILGACYALTLGASTFMNKCSYGDTFLKERRWSLMPWGGWQPDRYIALCGLGRVSPLIRYRT